MPHAALFVFSLCLSPQVVWSPWIIIQLARKEVGHMASIICMIIHVTHFPFRVTLSLSYSRYYFLRITERGVLSVAGFCYVFPCELRGPPWAVGSYSISQSAGGTSQNIIFKTLRQIGRPALYSAVNIHSSSPTSYPNYPPETREAKEARPSSSLVFNMEHASSSYIFSPSPKRAAPIIFISTEPSALTQA